MPPHAADRPLRRVLVAVEGDGESTTLRGLFERLGGSATPEVIALHVIEPSELPPFADSPAHEAAAFEQEFMIQVSGTIIEDPSRIRFEMRVGDAPTALREAAEELDVDMAVLAWRRTLAGGTRPPRARDARRSIGARGVVTARRRRSPPERRHLSVQLAADSCSAAYTCSQRLRSGQPRHVAGATRRT